MFWLALTCLLTLQPPAETTAKAAPAEGPGLQPVEFPLDSARRKDEQPLERLEPAPTSMPRTDRRSIVDLRDPFDRPPARPRTKGSKGTRLLLPDLKDPFADGIRRVRSRTFDIEVPNDLRNPFRDGVRAKPIAKCHRTTQDGVVVQKPGAPAPAKPCVRDPNELHDPFHDTARAEQAKLDRQRTPPPPKPKK